MNTRIVCLLSLALWVVSLYAAPYGNLSCSLRTATDNRIIEVALASGSNWVVISGPLIRYGIDAVPDLGKPVVVHKGGPQGIEELYGSGSRRTIVTIASSGTNVDPCVTHDGMYVAYVQRNVSVSNEDVLYTLDLATLADTPVYTTPLWGVDIFRPRFSADGQTLYFGMVDSHYGSQDIYSMPRTGGVPQELTGLPEGAMHPCLSPDGTMLACVAQNGGTFEPYVANPDGSSPRRIDLGGQFALYPCFSPDSKYLATCSDNGLTIIDLATDQIVQSIPLDYEGYYGLCWHMGARKSDGTVTKMKVSPKKIKIKAQGLGLVAPVEFGLLKVDQTVLPFNTTGVWQNKKDKKYMYKNKAQGLKAKLVVKKGKASFSAKNLNLTEGTDYRVNQPIPVTVHFTRESVIETITLDEKGKYKAPK